MLPLSQKILRRITQMKLSRKPRLRGSGWNCLLAFLIPFGGMLLVMLVNGYHPFGTSAMLYSDNYHQYYPFFVSFRRALLSGDSLLYSWDVGMGVDYLGLIAYYLGSPLNLLSVLVPESQVLNYFCLLVPIKLGLAGLFFSIFLHKLFDRDDFHRSVRRLLCPVRLGAGLPVECDVAGYLRSAAAGDAGHGAAAAG